MACEKAWERAWSLAREMNQAFGEQLSKKPYTQLGQVVSMTSDELKAQREAEEKHVRAAEAYQAAAEEAIRLSYKHEV